MVDLVGRLHPLLVHLPIGVLILSFIFDLASQTRNFQNLRHSVVPALAIGTVCAVFSCVTGYMLAQEGGYEDALVTNHQWMGIATAVLSILVLMAKVVPAFSRIRAGRWIVMSLFALTMVTLALAGHFGGSLTHGEDFLLEPVRTAGKVDALPKRYTGDPGQAVVYADVIEPLLRQKCFSCHSASKQKGGLRMDSWELLLKGGKHGSLFDGSIPDSTLLFKRLALPIEDEHHMPPRKKEQLNSSELALIHAWLADGARPDKRTNEFANAGDVMKFITMIQARSAPGHAWLPAQDVAAPNGEVVKKLGMRGVLVTPVASEGNHVMASFVNAKEISVEDMDMLASLKEQLVWLKLSNHRLGPEALARLSDLENLRVLYMDNTNLTDSGALSLRNLGRLHFLNLVGTSITDLGLQSLSDITSLRNLYLFRTQVTAAGVAAFSNKHPGVKVDTGGYALPRLESDTIIYRRQ